MVWKGTSVEEAKRRFVNDRLSGDWDDMSALCAAYGISRQAGYELMRRYEIEGFGCAMARSRAPREHGRRLDEEIVAAVIECRQDHPTWGPRKLLAYLSRRAPEVDWPAASTIGDHLLRHGLIRLRRRKRKLIPLTRPFCDVDAPNGTWSIDFKGWARTGDGVRFDPLTVSDNHSRFSLECRIMDPVGSAVEAAMERLFRDVGLPARLRADNGSPWGSRGPCGLTRTSVKVEAGDRSGVHQPRRAAGERATRALSRDLASGNDEPASGDVRGATGPVRSIPEGVQRGAASRGARPGPARQHLHGLCTGLSAPRGRPEL